MSTSAALAFHAPAWGRRILALENPEAAVDSVRTILLDAGYSVERCTSASEALVRLGERPADAIVVNLAAPARDGWELRAAQREDASIAGIPIVSIAEGHGVRPRGVYADVCLERPIVPTELLMALERALLVRERRSLAERFEETERLAILGKLAAGIGHELQNPLSFAMGNLELLERALPSLRKAALGLGEASEGSREEALARLSSRIDAVFDCVRDTRAGLERVRLMARNLAGLSRRPHCERMALDVRAVLESSISIARSHIDDRAILTRTYAATADVYGSEPRLGQVFLNLLVNAAQAILPGRPQSNEIRVSTFQDGDAVVIEVVDTGQGMSKTLMARIFEPFFTTKARGDGTGLGLPICRDIVEEHGGRLEVESELGQGSRFVVRLPGMRDGALAADNHLGAETLARYSAK